MPLSKDELFFDAVRMISDVMEFTKMRDCQSIMTAIDFEKAFDSLNWNFLLKSLEFFGFGEYVLQKFNKLCDLGPVQTPLHSCAEPNR